MKTKKSTTAKVQGTKAKAKTAKISVEAKTAKKIKAKTEEVAVSKVIVNKVLKYKYPAGVVDTLDRKSWRQKVRNEMRAAERVLAKAKTRDEKSKAKEVIAALEAKYIA